MYFMAVINCDLKATRDGMNSTQETETWEFKVSIADLKMNLPLTDDVKTFTAYGVNTIYVFDKLSICLFPMAMTAWKKLPLMYLNIE